jgi:hypothetical protein
VTDAGFFNVRLLSDKMPLMFERWILLQKRKRIRRERARLSAGQRQILDFDSDDASKLAWQQLRNIDRQIGALATNQLIEEAEAYDVAIPDYEPPDAASDFRNSAEFRSDLRKRLEEEKALKFESKMRWVKLLTPILTLLIGLIGTITGLVAVFKKH